MSHIYSLNSLIYLTISICLILGLLISILLIIISYSAAIHAPDAEKTSPYECGFEPFEDARSRFDVRFYIVAILFLIFDMEVAYLFPWTITLGQTGFLGYSIVVLFLLILTVGFAYEWVRGALDLH